MIGLAFVAAPALAQEEPRFCPNRPDLGASACTTEPGRVLVEMSGIDWQREDTVATREDTVLAGDLLVRFGVGPNTEVQVGWTAFGRSRLRDKLTNAVDVVEGVGDVRLAVRRNLQGNSGGNLELAVEPFVTVPVGRAPIGAGDWSGGVVLPVGYQLRRGWSLLFTGEASAAPDEDGQGHHLAWGGTLGLGREISDQVSAVVELAASRADDGAGETELVTALSFGWQPRPGLQFDILGVAGLNRAAPDLQIQIGGAILF
ncbi:transporter [Sphingomonas sp.]|uniref:transporter n=1 Tax=Sphingomonas sp. TaxID=28214 RepID=UPI002D7EE2E1|nr:transporter [Sphingomonas sp.]HEU0045205.1 transporter [Sphingomonas sp.]